MSAWFSIEVRLLNGRYHGRDANTQPEWPPTPLRLFQAIVAGALSGRWALEDRPRTEQVLRWLEALGAPDILLAPKAQQLRSYRLAVPNNQADRHIAALRRGMRLEKLVSGDKELKAVRPWLVGRTPVIYAWRIDDDHIVQAEATRPVIRRLVVLGTGIDHAAADIRVAAESPIADDLVPWLAGASPCTGTLQSLLARHKADLERMKTGSLRENRPPVRYCPAEPLLRHTAHLVFAFHPPGDDDTALPLQPNATAIIAQQIRQSLAEELTKALSKRGAAAAVTPEEVERLVTGRGANDPDKSRRVQVSPLPSIGHAHADGLLRRVLVSVPNDFPIAPESVRRALTRCEFEIEYPSQRPLKFQLAVIDETDDSELRMRERYVGRARVWRSVSPVILPGRRQSSFNTTTSPSQSQAVDRARVDAKRRVDRETLFQRALIHAGLTGVTEFRLRQEPFDPHQPRANADWRLPVSAGGEKRAWLSNRPLVHAEVTFDKPQNGPVLIGDGRFLGLGLFRAVMDEMPNMPEAARYRLGPNGRPRVEETILIADVLRRALMSGGIPPSELTGHDGQGSSRDPTHRHAFFLPEDADSDGLIDHLTVYCRFGFSDHALQRLRSLQRLWWKNRRDPAQSYELTLSLPEIGPPATIPGIRHLIGPGRVWRSATPYLRPRFPKKRDTDATSLAHEQICREWSLRFPGEVLPDVCELDARQSRTFETVRTDRDRFSPDKRGSLLQLKFSVPITGPVVLGRSSHFGLGLFIAEDV